MNSWKSNINCLRNSGKTYNDPFQYFNSKRSKYIERSKIRCGGILFTKDLKAIVIVQNKYILNENKKELWGLPKGHIKKNESYAQCAQREIYEETGLELDVQDTSPKIRINKTYYFPILLNYTLDELMEKLHIIDVTEIADICILHIDNPTISKKKCNYELKLLLGHYLSRAKNIVDALNLQYGNKKRKSLHDK
tara:strand:- start:1508 stop:2089 length:582 start_codon:yes stop_codon:yes gene_type:complete